MASLTGESVPVEVGAGEAVLAGSINTNGRLEVAVTQVGAATTLGKIIALMRTAERAKPPVTRLLERYAGHYMMLVLIVAGGTWFASGDTAATLAVLVASWRRISGKPVRGQFRRLRQDRDADPGRADACRDRSGGGGRGTGGGATGRRAGGWQQPSGQPGCRTLLAGA